MIRFLYATGVVLIGSLALLGLTRVAIHRLVSSDSFISSDILAEDKPSEPDTPEPQGIFSDSGENTSPEMPYLLARRYEVYGKYDAAFMLYEKSASTGYAPAFLALSDLYALGHGTPASQEKSLHYLKKAADSGIDVAQYNYANKLRDLTKTEEDLILAGYYYRLAADNGIKFAQLYLKENTEKCLAAPSLPRTPDSAKACLLASHTQNGEIEAAISTLFKRGDFLQTNAEKAHLWATKSIKHGSFAGKLTIIHNLIEGYGTKRAPLRAYILYKSIKPTSPEQRKALDDLYRQQIEIHINPLERIWIDIATAL